MSRSCTAMVEDQSVATGNARTLLLVLTDSMNSITGDSWLAVGTMANRANMSEREVQLCLRELEKLGELKVVIGGGPRKTNLYTLGPNYSPNPDPILNPLSNPGGIDPRIGLGANRPRQSGRGGAKGVHGYDNGLHPIHPEKSNPYAQWDTSEDT